MPRIEMLAAHHTQNSSNGLPCRSESGMGSIPCVSMLHTRSLAGWVTALRSTSTPIAPLSSWDCPRRAFGASTRGRGWETTRPEVQVAAYASRVEEVRERFLRSPFHNWIGMSLEHVETGA